MTTNRRLSDWAKLIRNQPEIYVDELYRMFRDEFILYSFKYYEADECEAKDAFQEGVVACYRSFSKGDPSSDTASIKTYLFQICKHKLIDIKRRNRNQVYLSNSKTIKEVESKPSAMSDEPNFEKEKISKALASLPDDCQKLLELYYLRGYDMESIARELKLKNANVAKSKKVSCMKKLAEVLNQMSTLLL